MSSAALQTAPHQSALASPPLAPVSNRQYTSSHSSPTSEPNNANLGPTSPPSSRRPPSRKTSGGSAPAFDPSNPIASRSGVPYSTSHQSPTSDRAVNNMPPVAPPRTSSNQQASSSRRAQYSGAERAASSPRRNPAESSRSGGRADTNGATENGHRSKRSYNSHNTPESTSRPSESRDARPVVTTVPIRTQQPESSRAEDARSHNSRADSQPLLSQDDDGLDLSPMGTSNAPDERRGTRSRHDHANKQHKGHSKIGDFILGNTIGEGEFGKVKLGWKQDSNVQFAVKMIKRDVVGGNPSRLAKIKREVTILRGVQHPNIVQLIDMVETDRYIGIVLEYASGGELFDYILNHRYLKDQSARRLFAQLVSGVGYLHKKGIVHRDLKLENLLLDRNRNIIITDFGFANTFDSNEELAAEEEQNLTDRDFVKRSGLDKVRPNGTRKGDLMQTSCGSPCYAAPELVVSDSLYTGRKVDVWSCGVILYAMLAGYLPFDDDPANPEGDNINLLYKYIVTTPLTFPEYVTPHARDLLRRILVPNPRKRADLFEVARHTWLSDYAHVVEFITSSTTLPSDVQNSSTPDGYGETPGVTRSSSVREGTRQKTHSPTSVGGLSKTHGKIDAEAEPAQRTPKDTKRRTVQVEYVAPTTRTQRGSDRNDSRSRTRSASRTRPDVQEKPLPRDPPSSQVDLSRPGYSSQQPPSTHKNATGPRGPREPRANTEYTYLPQTSSSNRPQTGGSVSSATSMGLQSRGYGQPAPPTVADTNAEGRIQQPLLNDENEPVAQHTPPMPSKFARVSGAAGGPPVEGRGHKRSSTLTDLGSKLLGRNASVFGKRDKRQSEMPVEKSRKYPPVSMSNTMPAGDEPGPRPSIDSRASRRSFSQALGLDKKRSGSMTGSRGSNSDKADRRRFSLLPASFSLKSIGLGKENSGSPRPEMERVEPPRSVTAHGDARGSSPFFDHTLNNRPQPQTAGNPVRHQRYASAQLDNRRPNAIPAHLQAPAQIRPGTNNSGDSRRPPTEPQQGLEQEPYLEPEYRESPRLGSSGGNRSLLQKNAKRFTDAYEGDNYGGKVGSSGAARRVMDLFRRRGKARGGEDRV